MSTYEGPGYGPDSAPTQVAPPPQGGGQMPYATRGYGQWGYGPPRPSWSRGMIETKPFFLTSEFFGPLLAITPWRSLSRRRTTSTRRASGRSSP